MPGLAGIQDGFQNYALRLPTQIPKKAAQSFIATAAISLIAGSAFSAALVGGALAVAATLIEAIARPTIQDIFPENPFIRNIIRIFMPTLLVLGLAGGPSSLAELGFKVASLGLVKVFIFFSLNPNWDSSPTAVAEIL